MGDKPTTTDPGATPDDFEYVPAPPSSVTAANAIEWFKSLPSDLRRNLASQHIDVEVRRLDDAAARIMRGKAPSAPRPQRWKHLMRIRRELLRLRDTYNPVVRSAARLLRDI